MWMGSQSSVFPSFSSALDPSRACGAGLRCEFLLLRGSRPAGQAAVGFQGLCLRKLCCPLMLPALAVLFLNWWCCHFYSTAAAPGGPGHRKAKPLKNLPFTALSGFPSWCSWVWLQAPPRPEGILISILALVSSHWLFCALWFIV